MMWNLFRAEWIKIMGNRWMTSLLIWIFPVGMLAYMVIMIVAVSLLPSMRGDEGIEMMGLGDVQWTEQAYSTWSFPNSLFGRLVLLAFTSVVFAGEYQWGTWKNLLPHSQRVPLVLVKFFAVTLLAVLSFFLMSVFYTVGVGIVATIAGASYGPALSGAVLTDFLGTYAQHVTLTMMLTVISAGYAALAAMLMRSVLGGAIAGLVVTFIEGLSVVFLLLVARFLRFDGIVHLYRLTPSYNVANVNSWLTHNRAEIVGNGLLGDVLTGYEDPLVFSVVMLLVWVVALMALTAYLFKRQDVYG